MLNAIVNTDSELGGTVSAVIFLLFFVGAIAMFIAGVIGLVDAYGSNPANTRWGAWFKIIIASALAALSEVITSASDTLFGNGVSPGSIGGQASGTSSTATCSVSSSTGNSSSVSLCALQNLKSLAAPAIHLVFVICFVAGVVLVGATLWNVAHEWSQQRHNRRFPWIKLFLGAALTTPGFLINMIESTLGINNAVVGTGGFSAASSYLAYAPPTESVINNLGGNFSSMLSASMNIFAFFGVVAFMKGVFILIKASDHHGAGGDNSVGRAATHMVGGVLMANMGWTLPAIGTYVFGAGSNFF